jgi:rhodanese-related sulfurtransferase
MIDLLAPLEAQRRVEEMGGALVDLRPPAAFARGHPAGAISLPYSEQSLELRLEPLLPGRAGVVLLAEDGAQAAGAVAQLAGGSRFVTGILDRGMAAWAAAGLAITELLELTIEAMLEKGDDLAVLDVREPMEWELGHVPGALLIPLGELRLRFDELPAEPGLAVICESGIRSSTGASLLLREGFRWVANVVPGTRGYRLAGHPLAHPY